MSNLEDSMESIDFKTITDRVVTELRNTPLERRWRGFFNNCVEKIDVTPDWIRKQILEKVWCGCMEVLNGLYADAEPLLAEKALSELLKKEVIRERIIYKKDSFRLSLENGKYRVYKNGPRGATLACPWPSDHRYEISISGHRFAEFIMRFDGEIPNMVAFIPKIMETLRERELKERRRQMEADLKEQLLASLIEQYIKPLGISIKYRIGEDDVVSVDLSQILTAHLEVPLSKIQETLKDTTTLVGLLRVVPQEESNKLQRELYTSCPGLI